MALVAIDPGKAVGFAEFNGELTNATVCTPEECLLFIENAARISRARSSGDCVIEIPQVYPGQQQKGDQNDLILLAVMVGKFAERAKEQRFGVALVKPREWKGQLPKDVCWRRVRETLTPLEFSRIPELSKSRAHNMHDAIGLGTWFQKRWR